MSMTINMKSIIALPAFLLLVFTVPAAEIQVKPDGPISLVGGTDRAEPVAAASKGGFTNSLGMRFVPVPVYKGKGSSEAVRTVLMSQWHTRVKDYQAFCDATGRAWKKPLFPRRMITRPWKLAGRTGMPFANG